ncbi:MAG: two-component regulator propeller domain-containing protein, partial [Chitinophagales bacterium]
MNTGSSLCIRQAGLVFFLILILISPSSIAQLNSANLTQYSEKDGLPGVQVRRVLSDKLGYLWFGTINGLARYDGYEFKRFYYDPNDSSSIHGLSVWSLYEDHKGNIWTGTSPSSLNKYDPVLNKFKQYEFTHLIKHPANTEIGISSICEDNNARMYFGVDTYLGNEITTDLLYKDAKEDSIKRF